MDIFPNAPGFLGTGASLLADLTLAAYVLVLLPLLLIGYRYARRGKHRPQHKWLMIAITLINWLLIAGVMLAALRLDVAPNLPQQPANARYWLAALHALVGLPAQLLATYIVVRMLIEDAQVARARQRGETDVARYWFRGARWTMRLTTVLWLAAIALGVFTYLVRYDVLAVSAALAAEPAATEEAPVTTPEAVSAPVTTPEAVSAPVSTPEVVSAPRTGPMPFTTPSERRPRPPISTPEAVPPPAATPEIIPLPVTTPEVVPAPVFTPEVRDDSDGRDDSDDRDDDDNRADEDRKDDEDRDDSDDRDDD